MKQCRVVLIGFLSAAAALLGNCDAIIVDPKGDADRDAPSIVSVIVPVTAMTFWFASKSRAIYAGGPFAFSIAYLSCVFFIFLFEFIVAHGRI